MKPISIVIGFVLFMIVLANLPKSETEGAPKPEPPKKAEPKLVLKSQQCVSCEDLAEVEARVTKLEATVKDLACKCEAPKFSKPAPVKLIPTTPIRKPAPAKSAKKQSASNCANGRCSMPSYSFGRRGRR